MANEEMIQKHLDNFLAKIAGETPVDDEPRDSTEFWLNEIAEQGGGGGSEVVANPPLEGGEDDLTSVEIDGTKYAVPKGSYIATMRTATYVSAESVTFMQNNYMTTPCYVPYGNYLFRMARLLGDTFISAPLNASNAISDFNLTQIFVENNGSIIGQNQLVPRVTANPSTTGSANLAKLSVNGTTYNIPTGTSVEANPTLAGTEANLTGLEVDGTKYKVRDGATNGLGYLTTAPTAANTDGIKIVVLSSEPATKYNGYLYIILA